MKKRVTIDTLQKDKIKMRCARKNGLVPPEEYQKFMIDTEIKIKKLQRGKGV